MSDGFRERPTLGLLQHPDFCGGLKYTHTHMAQGVRLLGGGGVLSIKVSIGVG